MTLEHLYFSTMKMGPSIFIVRDYSQTCDFFRVCVCVCEQCYGLVLWFLLNTATSLTALLLAINYSLKRVFVLLEFISFLHSFRQNHLVDGGFETLHDYKNTSELECAGMWLKLHMLCWWQFRHIISVSDSILARQLTQNKMGTIVWMI